MRTFFHHSLSRTIVVNLLLLWSMLFLYWLIKRQYPEMLLGCKIPAEPMLSKLLAKTISLSEHNLSPCSPKHYS